MSKLVRRTDRDISQQLRLAFQLAFLALNAVIGVQFYLWVRGIEGAASGVATRPAGVEGWLPIAGLMNLKAWLVTHQVPAVHPAAMVLVAAFLVISFVMRKAFCSWLCPIGTFSEWLWKLGRKVACKNLALPKWLDIPLRSLKYLLLSFFLFAVLRTPAEAVAMFMASPYGLIADVKMLNFFRFLGTAALIVIAVLIALSVVIQNFWCRYLCPYGALLGLASVFSPAKIRRDADACIDCAKCAKACPARLPVDVKPMIRSAECSMCMSCVAVCPAKDALEVKITPSRKLPAWAVAATIAAIFLGAVTIAKLTGHWQTLIPREVYEPLVRDAALFGH